MSVQAKTLAKLRKDTLALFSEPPKLSIRQWAHKHQILDEEVTGQPGRYSADEVPFQNDPMDWVLAPDVQVTVLLWGSRLGKTTILNNAIGYFMDEDPSTTLIMYPTQDGSETWCKGQLQPMIRNNPRLRRRVRASNNKGSKSTILRTKYPGGSCTAIGSNSPSGLRGRQARVVIGDEIDQMDWDAGGEGDPLGRLFKRAENYKDSVQIVTSTPTIKGFSRIEDWFNKGDKCYWFCPCPECGEHQTLKWSNVIWKEVGVENAYYRCEKCEAHLNDDDRVEMVKRGEWRATAPFKGIRSSHLNGIYNTFPPKKGYKSKIHQFAQEFLDAHNSANKKEALKAWTNTFLAEAFEDEAEVVDWERIFARRESYDGRSLNKSIAVVVAGVDVQADRIEVEVVAWGVGEESWGVEYKIFMGNPIQDYVWKQLDEFLCERYPHELGGTMGIASAFIDTGHLAPRVYNFTRSRESRKIYACKGVGGFGIPLSARSKREGKATLMLIGTNSAKELIYSRLNLIEEGVGYMHYPMSYDQEYFKQLTAEKCQLVFRNGTPYKGFILPPNTRNEALDIRVYATAAFHALNCNPKKLLQRLQDEATSKMTEAQKQAAAAAIAVKTTVIFPKAFDKPAPVINPTRVRNNFVNGWNKY